MNYRDAQWILSEGEPKPEDLVDIECPNCAGQWCSSSRGIYQLGDNEETIYRNFIGVDHISWGEDRPIYRCPNGCTDYAGEVVELHDIIEAGNHTPMTRYEHAKALVKLYELEQELENVRHTLKQYEGMY
ncbi:hypothetical protein [Vibrio phage VCPH]|nr:hypothetical protein [Vibrio phage VCPH]